MARIHPLRRRPLGQDRQGQDLPDRLRGALSLWRGEPLADFAAIFILTIGLGLSYGPMSAMYAEMFPASVRYSGIGIGYALGSILGGAFAPLLGPNDAACGRFSAPGPTGLPGL